jgi:arabinofuranosyltransferase
MAWEIFSIIYYGFPFPNTYYSKLGAGIQRSDRFLQGIIYYLDSIWRDPLTLTLIVSAMMLAFVFRRKRTVALAAGLGAYLAYVAWVGGDFMSGRFLAIPVFGAVAILAVLARSVSLRFHWVVAAVVIAVGLLGTKPPPLSGASFGSTSEERLIRKNGICDERAYYYQQTGLLLVRRNVPMPNHWWAEEGKSARASHLKLLATGMVGFAGFYAGPDIFVLDPIALADPFLARLPADNTISWRTGHLGREVPEGYQVSMEQDKNLLADSSLAIFYDKLCTVTKGPVWSAQRFTEILNFNLGRYGYLIEQYVRRPDTTVRFADMNPPRKQGTAWNTDGNYMVHHRGLMIQFDGQPSAKRIEISVDNNDQYTLYYYFDSLLLGNQEIESRPIHGGGLRVDTLSVPEDAQGDGFNAILVRPSGGDSKYSIGHLRLLDRRDL